MQRIAHSIAVVEGAGAEALLALAWRFAYRLGTGDARRDLAVEKMFEIFINPASEGNG